MAKSSPPSSSAETPNAGGALGLNLPSDISNALSIQALTALPHSISVASRPFQEMMGDKCIYPPDEYKELKKLPVPTGADPAPPEGIADTHEALAVCLAPDVCRTPIGPAIVSIPYQVFGKAGDDSNYSPNVYYNGFRAMRFNSRFFKTYGDEPGKALGRVSNTVEGIVEPTSHSTIVRVNGQYAIRHGDTVTLNSGNTPGEMLFIKNVEVIPPPDGEEKKEFKSFEDRTVGPNLKSPEKKMNYGQERQFARENGVSEKPKIINDGFKTKPLSFDYNAFKAKGSLNEKPMYRGKNGSINSKAFNGKVEAGAVVEVSKGQLNAQAKAGANVSALEVEAEYGNNFVQGSARVEALSANAEASGGVAFGNGKLKAEGEAGAGAVLTKIEGGGGLRIPVYPGWGIYVGCNGSASVGAELGGGGAVGTLDSGIVGVNFKGRAAIGLGLGFGCTLGVATPQE